MNVRDWIHVKDHCRAIDVILRKGKAGAVYNIGADCEMPNVEIVRYILERMNKVRGQGPVVSVEAPS